MSTLTVEVSNCNNLDFAAISLEKNKLNIKFAPNGTGKSTVSRALQLYATGGQDSLKELMPFKLRTNNPKEKEPTVVGIDKADKIFCFNEAYVSQFVFKPDELVANSFEIFIRGEDYQQKEREIEALVKSIKDIFLDNAELDALISILKEMGDSFKQTKTGLSKASKGMKGLSAGNPIEHVPGGLEQYGPFIRSAENVTWIEWQTAGNKFLEISTNCPYCTSDTTVHRETIERVAKEYDKNIIKNLVSIIRMVEKLGEYLSEHAATRLEAITKLPTGLSKEHEEFIASVKGQIDNFITKLERLRTLSVFHFKEGDNISDALRSYRLDFQFFAALDSKTMREAVAPLNTSLDEVLEQAGKLQGKINQQRLGIKKTIEKHQSDINSFLSYAGYQYEVVITNDGENSQMKLRHKDHAGYLSGGQQHLSFGERNAFSIVLFMYECLAKIPSLIILDDPISSFDKNKKYAILEMLFRREATGSLKNKTVMMLTHDVEPVIDMVKSMAPVFGNQTTAAFLKLESNRIRECSINRGDIKTFGQICKDALADPDKDDIVKLIYMRRDLEVSDNKGDAYQVISNLLHKRLRAIDNREPKGTNGEHPEMDASKFSTGCDEISYRLGTFSYPELVKRVLDVKLLRSLYEAAQNGYEKLQIFRLIGIDAGSSVINKFINETYHIENEYICQLDPAKFDTVPEYVIAECDKLVAVHA